MSFIHSMKDKSQSSRPQIVLHLAHERQQATGHVSKMSFLRSAGGP
ncbi:hypothetical protein HMPREF3213_02765 [Heyndrickxia coagulans]|uniref:Uncharacterized protein n=1 Tax=Heyndrickxia coagulans TaxID=1398 RepID=A0A133KII5_HEYCO|nr:hypothetical protein HMPREF3213_02765 [Heyndrickxia coagulans]